MVFEDEALGPGFCFLRDGSGTNANGEASSGPTGRFAGAPTGAGDRVSSCHHFSGNVGLLGALDVSIAMFEASRLRCKIK